MSKPIYTLTRNIRGDLQAETRIDLGADRRILFIETYKRDGGIIATLATVKQRTEDGMSWTHTFSWIKGKGDDFRSTLEAVKGRATEKTIRAQHERALNDWQSLLDQARAHYAQAAQVGA